ncbi:MAG: TetR/AcrR family transcriptional regulator [Paludibacter sp.]|nr:TetR/AcrR family transcriptional regulator [Paludibacter sp.]
MPEIVLTKEDIIKGEVIDTAQKLFQQYGFKKTTMEDIAQAMGRGKSTLYYYYKSKDMIFRDVILKEATEVMTALTEATGNEISSEKKLQTYVITFFDVVKSKVSLYNMMKKELMADEGIYINKPSLKKSLLQFNAEQFNLVKEILILGVENKEFTSEIKDNIDVFAYILNVGLRSITFNLAFDAKSGMLGFFEDEKLKIMFNILMNGLRSV